MAVYTEIDSRAIAHLLSQHYDMGRLVSAKGIAEGVENSNYHLVMRDDCGEQTPYILTIYEKRMNLEDLPFFIGLMQHAAANGIICPAPIINKSGAFSSRLDIDGSDNGKAYAVFSFLPGQSIKITDPNHASQVGAALAKLHVATGEFEGYRANGLSLHYWQQTSELLMRGERGLNDIAPDLAELVADEVLHLAKNWPVELPSGVIHADLFPNNVFFDSAENLSGIIDFYFACNDAFAYDLAITINSWCFDIGVFQTEKARAMVQAYQQVRPLSPEEKDALPILLRGAAMRFLLTRAYDSFHNNQQAVGEVLDPMAYVDILQFHRAMKNAENYGF